MIRQGTQAQAFLDGIKPHENIARGPKGRPTLRASEWRDYAGLIADRLVVKAKPGHLRRREMHADSVSVEPPQESLSVDCSAPQALAKAIELYDPLQRMVSVPCWLGVPFPDRPPLRSV